MADAFELDRFCRRRVIAVSSVAAAAILVTALAIAVFGGTERALWLALTGIGVPAFSLGGLQAAQLRARRRVRAAQWPESLGFYTAAITLTAAFAVTHSCSTATILFAEVVSASALCVVSAWLLRPPAGLARSPLNIELRSEASGAARGLLMGQFATALGGRVPTLIAGVTLGSSAAGLLEVAMRIGQLGGIVTWASGIAVSPLFSESHAKRDMPRLQRLLTLSTWATLLPSLVILLVLAICGHWVLGVFGEQFQSALLPAVLIACAATVNASGGLASTLLYMTSHERTVVALSLASLLSLLLLGPILGLVIGVAGVAVAVLLASVIRDIGLSWLLVRRLSIYPPVWSGRGLTHSFRIIRELIVQRLGVGR